MAAGEPAAGSPPKIDPLTPTIHESGTESNTIKFADAAGEETPPAKGGAGWTDECLAITAVHWFQCFRHQTRFRSNRV